MNDKINASNASIQLGFANTGIKWGKWFGNGERVLTNTNEVDLESDFIISPNPSQDIVTITSDALIGKDVTIRLSQLTGELISNVSYGNFIGEAKVDVNQLASGTYVITLTSEEGQRSKLVFKK